MKHLRKPIDACISAMLLSACSGGSAALAPAAARPNPVASMGPAISSPCFSGPCIYVSNSRKFGGKARLLSYPVTARGRTTPVAEITGSATDLRNDLGIAVDASRRIYTDSFKRNDILVFAAGANGNIPPVQVIRGSNVYGVAVR